MCVPEVVDYVTDMADEVEAVIEAGRNLDALFEDRSDSLVWNARVSKQVLDISVSVNTIVSTDPPEPFPTVYEAIREVAADFERVAESAETDDASLTLVKAISTAVKN